MSRLTALLARAYALLLHLYPREFRDEFGEEMQTVFADAIQEAARYGRLALARLCWHELRELPVNSAMEHWARFRKGSMGMKAPAPSDDRPLSWFETLIGLLPFFIFGPLNVWLAFPFPYPAGSVARWFFASQILLFAVGALVGFIAGWITGWRRWSFPYLGLALLLLGGWIVSESNRWIYATGARLELSLLEHWLLAVGVFALVLGAFAAVLVAGSHLSRAVGSLRLLYVTIRQDWTQLSFGLYVIAAIILGGIDHDEDTALTLLLILPSVTVLFSALVYLRSTTRSRRIWSLVLGLAVAFALSIAREWFYLIYAVILFPSIFLPLLFELLPHQNRPALAE